MCVETLRYSLPKSIVTLTAPTHTDVWSLTSRACGIVGPRLADRSEVAGCPRALNESHRALGTSPISSGHNSTLGSLWITLFYEPSFLFLPVAPSQPMKPEASWVRPCCSPPTVPASPTTARCSPRHSPCSTPCVVGRYGRAVRALDGGGGSRSSSDKLPREKVEAAAAAKPSMRSPRVTRLH